MKSVVVGLLVGSVVGSTSGCEDPVDARRSLSTVVDVRAGTVRGVRLGDSRQAIRGALGPPSAEGRFLPRLPDNMSVEDLGIPWTLDTPPGTPRTRVLSMHYQGLSFVVAPKTGMYAFFAYHSAARTTRGVAIGDPLNSARARYRGLRCDVRNRNSEYAPYPYCAGKVGDQYLWFGQDPIRSITISSTAQG